MNPGLEQLRIANDLQRRQGLGPPVCSFGTWIHRANFPTIAMLARPWHLAPWASWAPGPAPSALRLPAQQPLAPLAPSLPRWLGAGMLLVLRGRGSHVARCSDRADDDKRRRGAKRSLQALREKFPDAAQDELWRFARARCRDPEAAIAMYVGQQRWRQGQGDPEALRKIFSKVPFGFVASGTVDALDGTRYTLAICHVLDGIFESEEDRVTVLIDVRRGEGWPNPPAIKLLPFIRACASIISDHYPERLSRLILFPVPWVAKVILGIVQRLLDPVTFNKIILVTGDDQIGSPCNAKELRKYITKESLPEHSWPMYQDL
eukprot:s464_g7.t1